MAVGDHGTVSGGGSGVATECPFFHLVVVDPGLCSFHLNLFVL